MGPEYRKLVEPKISVATPGDGEGAWLAGFGGGVGGVIAVEVVVIVGDDVVEVAVIVGDGVVATVEVDDAVVPPVVVDVTVAVFVDGVAVVPVGLLVGVGTVLFAPDGICGR